VRKSHYMVITYLINSFVTSCSGYMAPEYAFDGIFSIKSDVFSFGVLLLEIVSGQKNSRLFHPNDYNNLIGHVSDILCFSFLI